MQRMAATTRCGKETVFWWYAIGKKCTLIAKGGTNNDFWRENTKIEKGGRPLSRGTLLPVGGIQTSNQ